MATAVAVGSVSELAQESLLMAAAVSVPAGWPSPAQDYVTDPIDLTEQLVRDRAATVIMQVAGDSMMGAGIYHGDRILVDRGLEPRPGDIVVAVVNGEFTVKELRVQGNRVGLAPANARYPVILVEEMDELRIIGVVTYCLHRTSRG